MVMSLAENNTDRDRVMISISDPKKISCIQRMSQCEPRLYTKFLLSKPAHRLGKWEIRSYVNYEMVDNDAAVVVLLQKGLSVSEANYALWNVATLMLKASKKAKAAKKIAEDIAAQKSGGFAPIRLKLGRAIEYLVRQARGLFDLPTLLYNAVQRFIQARRK
jgi:hypothetical protein